MPWARQDWSARLTAPASSSWSACCLRACRSTRAPPRCRRCPRWPLLEANGARAAQPTRAPGAGNAQAGPASGATTRTSSRCTVGNYVPGRRRLRVARLNDEGAPEAGPELQRCTAISRQPACRRVLSGCRRARTRPGTHRRLLWRARCDQGLCRDGPTAAELAAAKANPDGGFAALTRQQTAKPLSNVANVAWKRPAAGLSDGLTARVDAVTVDCRTRHRSSSATCSRSAWSRRWGGGLMWRLALAGSRTVGAGALLLLGGGRWPW